MVLEPAAALRGLEIQARIEGMAQWQNSCLAHDQFQAASAFWVTPAHTRVLELLSHGTVTLTFLSWTQQHGPPSSV